MQNIIVTLQIEIRKKLCQKQPDELNLSSLFSSQILEFWLSENNITALISNDDDGNEKRDDVKQYQSSKRFGPQASK